MAALPRDRHHFVTGPFPHIDMEALPSAGCGNGQVSSLMQEIARIAQLGFVDHERSVFD